MMLNGIPPLAAGGGGGGGDEDEEASAVTAEEEAGRGAGGGATTAALAAALEDETEASPADSSLSNAAAAAVEEYPADVGGEAPDCECDRDAASGAIAVTAAAIECSGASSVTWIDHRSSFVRSERSIFCKGKEKSKELLHMKKGRRGRLNIEFYLFGAVN